MQLKPGMKVKLVPFPGSNVSLPGCNRDKEPYFNRIVTISKITSTYYTPEDETWFSIKEDGSFWIFTTRWIKHNYFVPDELFEIEE